MGDEKRLVQVLANLLNNAAKYTPLDGIISVEMSITDSEVCVEVIDNGIGIAVGMQKTVFSLFEQARDTSDRTLGVWVSVWRWCTV
ncbi:sensor histidine kinase [Massilia sp. CMS3.1]|uniref:sensor histidine kinase n=1 Tax=Massilia sp. CMS3.1 TaxID=3373083 RepID=UPI003EE67A04